ncbi:MAG TPA: S8 family serine peptidase, partial [Anaerolineales bacterium]|nr:S8 family serine peptidase [Anaerolineales bacterium]
MHRKLFNVLSLMLVLAVVSSTVSLASAQDDQPDVSGLLIPDGPVSVEVSPLLAQASGKIDLVVQLLDAPLAVGGGHLSAGQQRNYIRQLGQKQNTLLNQIRNLGGTEIARVSKALNAVIISIDASQIGALTALPNVRSVRPVGNYELDLTDTVPYIGATEVQTEGFDGTGVRVAVLDSGIDYLHYNLGGSGVVADFDANNPTVIELGSFPTAKVVGGFDFVGETWTGGAGSPALAPDPDPLDKGTGAGHGTHVADIIAGRSTDGLHKGVAPGASLYAVGVCSKITTSCSGVALLQGMDFALDPNSDDSIADAVDVVNMS